MEKIKKTILIAEDEVYNRMYMEELFLDKPYEVIEAEDGQKAIELFRQHKEIDLVLMDIKMPKMDGVEAMKAIKTMRMDTPVIGLSAVAVEFEDLDLLEVGFDAFISKPIDKKELFDVINKNLNK